MRIQYEIEGFEAALEKIGTRKRAEGEKKYLKSELDFIGVPVPQIRKLVGSWLNEHPELSRDPLVRLVRALWKRKVHELRSVAVFLLERRVEILHAEDLALVEDCLRHSDTWAYVDNLASRVAGPLVENYPSLRKSLDAWAGDDDFWIRRSALLALLLPLRRGEGDWASFVRYADSMLEEKEFFIRKAIGWVLRETGKTTPDRVYEYLSSRIDRVSGLTLREGAKNLPAKKRGKLLAAYRAR